MHWMNNSVLYKIRVLQPCNFSPARTQSLEEGFPFAACLDSLPFVTASLMGGAILCRKFYTLIGYASKTNMRLLTII